MSQYSIVRLSDKPEFKQTMAQWFHEKWGIPLEAYLESMEECLSTDAPYPQWYVALFGDEIVGGMGVIENDFHERKDLKPNVCAVYTEEAHRGRGIAGRLLNYVYDDMVGKGITMLYLLTDHTGFYERYGWRFLCPVLGDGEDEPARMYVRDR